MKKFLIFVAAWCVLLTSVLGFALVQLHKFLEDYQLTFENTRPKLAMEATVPMFDLDQIESIIPYLTDAELTTEALKTQFKTSAELYMTGKEIAFDTLADEHTEDRPAYVVTCGDEPLAIVRFQKQDTAAAYGLPLWEIKNIDWLMPQKAGYSIIAPVGITLKVNGAVVEEASAVETGMVYDRARYFAPYAQMPTLSKYSLDHIYGEPVIEATNAYGDVLDITLDEKTKTYVVDFGTNEALKAEVGDYMVQFVVDYANFISDDTPKNYLDNYFPKGSELLAGIKEHSRQYYDNHRTPEIKNQHIKEFIMYDDDTVCARVYVEQHMYLYHVQKVVVVDTDIKVYFYKDGDKWLVSGIAFENAN